MILNVNDREANRYAMTRMLRSAGYDVIEAETGAEALEKAQLLPDLVVLDVHLPDMSGLEVAQRIKADPATRHVLILHVSAISVFSRNRAEGLSHGADGYLTEPFEPAEFVATIEALLRMGRAEATARSSAREWQVSFDAMAEGLALLDGDGRIRRCNAALERLLEAGTRELDGRLLQDVLPGPTVAASFDALGTQRIRQTVEHRQAARTFRVTLDPVAGDRDPLAGAVAVVADVTRLKKADAALHFLSEASDVLMSSLEMERPLSEVARRAAVSVCDVCLVEVLREEAAPRRFAAVTSGLTEVEYACSRFVGDGHLAPLLAAPHGGAIVPASSVRTVSALGDGAAVIVPLQIRERALGTLVLGWRVAPAAVEAEDLELGLELARRISQALENVHLHEAAHQAIHTRDEFFSIASHELKSPLAALLLQLKLLQRELRRTPQRAVTPEAFGAKVDAAERNATRLGDLVQELLDTTRIRAGRLELHREGTDLTQLVRDVVMRFEGQAGAIPTGLQVDTVAGIVRQWDRSRVEQVVTNLVSNAIKYGEGKPVDVRVRRTPGGEAELVVTDRGIGVSPEDQARIFEPFERGRSSGAVGLGLGLYISRMIVEAHGGTVKLQSVPGQGSTFTVTLPLASAAATGETNVA